MVGWEVWLVGWEEIGVVVWCGVKSILIKWVDKLYSLSTVVIP